MKFVPAAALAAMLSASAAAADTQDLDALDAKVAAFLGGSATAQPVDRRIKLARCPAEIAVSGPVAGAVAVRARGNKDLGAMSVEAFSQKIAHDIASKS